MILVFLQNAYRPTGKYISRDEWLGRMWASHTGRRLRTMLPDNAEVYVENASPRIGRKSNSEFPPDLEHMKSVIDRINPRVILGCGRFAQTGLNELGVDYMPAPHPAWRALSKKEAARIQNELHKQF